MEHLISGRLVGLQGRLRRPFWGLAGPWAVLCGALAAEGLAWGGEALLTLMLVLLLTELAWGSLWDLATGTDWFGTLVQNWPAEAAPVLPRLPYTQPGSPGGRLVARLEGLAGWWRGAFWPEAGPSLLGLLAAVILAVALALLLPASLRPLHAAVVALAGLGLAWRRHGRDALAGAALVQVGLGWLAGHLVFADLAWPSLLMGLFFAAAVWGGLRLTRGLAGGVSLLNAGQAAVAGLLVVQKQPLAAGAVGLLLLGQVALQPGLYQGDDAGRLFRRTWPWLLAAMLLAALALP
jgi:hypothetical protein